MYHTIVDDAWHFGGGTLVCCAYFFRSFSTFLLSRIFRFNWDGGHMRNRTSLRASTDSDLLQRFSQARVGRLESDREN